MEFIFRFYNRWTDHRQSSGYATTAMPSVLPLLLMLLVLLLPLVVEFLEELVLMANKLPEGMLLLLLFTTHGVRLFLRILSLVVSSCRLFSFKIVFFPRIALFIPIFYSLPQRGCCVYV